MSEAAEEFSGRLTNIQVTAPDMELRHYISDGELESVGSTGGGVAKDLFLMMAGGFLGSVVPAIEQISKIDGKESGISAAGLFAIIICAGTFFCMMVLGYIWWDNAKKFKSTVEKIRSRPKRQVLT